MGCGATGGLLRHQILDFTKIENLTGFFLGPHFVLFSPTKRKTRIFLQKWLHHLLLMMSYLITIVTNAHQSCVKMCVRDMHTATGNGRWR